ncbi:MAG: AtpZ/AtpI family protein [Candidatus Omnitrophica bacterium]|nr:AtpZ/AtpI family protein [Candidatus Omnitrophota bacterium]
MDNPEFHPPSQKTNSSDSSVDEKSQKNDRPAGKSIGLHKRVKIACVLSVMPFVVAIGPVSGYFLGEYLRSKFGFNYHVVVISLLLGTVVSIKETIKIIKLALKFDKEP